LQLGNDDDAVGIGGMDIVANVNTADARAPLDGRGNCRVLKLSLCIVDTRLVAFDLRLEPRHGGLLGIEGLLAGEILRSERDVAFEVRPRALQLSFVLGLRRPRLTERCLKRTRIDLRQQVALAHCLAFLERNLLQLAIDARGDRYGVERLNRAQALEMHRNIRTPSRRDVHGDSLLLIVGRGVSGPIRKPQPR
jgi:hypothetical protein